jgi:serine/threonine protein kinase
VQDLLLSAKGEDLTVLDAVRMGKQLASALGFLHARSVAHCDVKATNVLLTDAMVRAI